LAVGMADLMERPVYVVRLNHNDIFRTERWNPYREYIAGINDQERGELRRMVVTTACSIMREQMAIDWTLARLELEQLMRAALAINAMMVGLPPAAAPAPVVMPDPEPVTPPVPVPLEARPAVPEGLRQRFELQYPQ